MHNKFVNAAHWLHRRAENVSVLLLAIMFAVFIVQIFCRYALNMPLGWSEEVIITTWLWTVLWGAAFVLRESEEIRFDILYSNISESARRVLNALTGIVLIVAYVASLPAAYRYVNFMKVERSAYLQVPINWMYSVFVIFSVACIVRYAYLVYCAFAGAKQPEADPAKLAD